MSIIMTYHELTERSSDHISTCWKWSIIATLTAIIGCSLIVMFSYEGLNKNFNSNAIANAKIKFLKSDNGTSTEIVRNFNDFNDLTDDDDIDVYLVLDENRDEEIDEIRTLWGRYLYNEYIKFAPFMMAVYAIVWATIFFLCAHGGNSSRNRRAWRIVIPAIIFFTIMLIASAYYSILLCEILSSLCIQFRNHSNNTDTRTCPMLMDYFALNKTSIVAPSKNYSLAESFAWCTTVLWLISLTIMIIRCVFVIDFELVHVIIYEVTSPKKSIQMQKNKDETEKFYDDTLKKEIILNQPNNSSFKYTKLAEEVSNSFIDAGSETNDESMLEEEEQHDESFINISADESNKVFDIVTTETIDNNESIVLEELSKTNSRVNLDNNESVVLDELSKTNSMENLDENSSVFNTLDDVFVEVNDSEDNEPIKLPITGLYDALQWRKTAELIRTILNPETEANQTESDNDFKSVQEASVEIIELPSYDDLSEEFLDDQKEEKEEDAQMENKSNKK